MFWREVELNTIIPNIFRNCYGIGKGLNMQNIIYYLSQLTSLPQSNSITTIGRYVLGILGIVAVIGLIVSPILLLLNLKNSKLVLRYAIILAICFVALIVIFAIYAILTTNS